MAGLNKRLIFLQKLLSLAILFTCLVVFGLLNYFEKSTYQPVKALKEDTRLLLFGNLNVTTDILKEELNRKRLTQTIYPLTLTAPYIIENPQICTGKVSVLIIVHTAIDHFQRRDRIRATFGNINLFKSNYTIRTAFLLGETSDNKTSLTVKEENDKHHDIVQGPFQDTYKNLTLKGVMGFRWISLHCSQAELILKIDDDVFVNIFKLLDYYLPKFSKKSRLIMCNTMYPSSVLRWKTRWRIDVDLFREVDYYPPYCSGFTVLMTTDTIKVMYGAAQISPFFWIDDVYLFGLLPSKANIIHGKLNKNVSLNVQQCIRDYNTRDPHLLSCGNANEDIIMYCWKRSVLTLHPSLRAIVSREIIKSLSLKEKET